MESANASVAARISFVIVFPFNVMVLDQISRVLMKKRHGSGVYATSLHTHRKGFFT
jgi:hypothetical protein